MKTLTTHPKFIDTTWELSSYEVWGNARDGYEVNDVRRHGEESLRIRVTVNNAGTPQEFLSAYPTDSQIRRIGGLGRFKLDIDGDDTHIYVNRARDGYPLGEMFCTSHESLSPIRPISKRIKCDQCQALMIQGVFCHETGCTNTHARYDVDSDTWVKQRKCFVCGCTVDADDLCCNAPMDEDEA